MPCKSRMGRPAPRRITSSSISPTDSRSAAEGVVACMMACPGFQLSTFYLTCGLRPDAHHPLEDVIQLLFIHLVRFIDVFDVEVQTVGHHPARINDSALLQRDHIFNVGGRIATACTRSR